MFYKIINFKLILFTLTLFFNPFHGFLAAFAESGMVSELRKTNPKDEAKIRDIKYRHYYKSKIERLNAIARSNKEARLKSDREETKGIVSGKPSAIATKSPNSPKSASTAKNSEGSSKKQTSRNRPSTESAAPIKVDSNIPDEMSFPGSDSENDE